MNIANHAAYIAQKIKNYKPEEERTAIETTEEIAEYMFSNI